MSVNERLEYLRGEIEAERISLSEILELQGLADEIPEGDTLLLEWAGVPEGRRDVMSDDSFTKKAPAIENLMESISGRRREEGHCVFEGDGKEHNVELRDELSQKEYQISGLCQICQDIVFGVEEV